MSSTDRCIAFEFSRAQAWVLHAALLDRVERETDAGNDIDQEMSLLRTIEHDEYVFDESDLELLRNTLTAYLADAPGRDRIPGQSLLDEIDGVPA
jgi:hypothetical protein